MQRSLIKTRANIQSNIWTYEKRREKLRIKYGITRQNINSTEGHPEYSKAVEKINDKIRSWNRRIRVIDELSNKIVALGNAVALFTGYNVKDSGNARGNERLILAKSLFYKYGLEHKISGKHLREYVGAKHIKQPADYRRNFTRLFSTATAAKNRWTAFNSYLEFESEGKIGNLHFIDNQKTS